MKQLSKLRLSMADIIPLLFSILLVVSACYFYYVVIESVFKFAKLSLEISQSQERNIKLLDKTNQELEECKRDIEKIRNNVEQ